MIYFEAFGWNLHFNVPILAAYFIIRLFGILLLPEKRKVALGNGSWVVENGVTELFFGLTLGFAVINDSFETYFPIFAGLGMALFVMGYAKSSYVNTNARWVSKAYLKGYRGKSQFVGPVKYLLFDWRKGEK